MYICCCRSLQHCLCLRQYNIKGKTSRKLQQEFTHLRKRYWGQHFWASGYFVVAVGNVNEEDIKKYVKEQEEHHKKDDFKISEY